MPDGPGRTKPLLWIGIVSVCAFAIVMPLLMLLNKSERTVVADGDLPVVAAEQGPEKVRPTDEGGMQPLNQDVAIYDTLERRGEVANRSPAGQPEAPMPLPPAAPAATPPASSDDAPRMRPAPCRRFRRRPSM